MDGRLHERAVGHGAGNLPRVIAGAAAAHLDAEHVCGPFAVVGDLAGERLAGIDERPAEGLEAFSSERSAAGGAVGQQEHGVVGARVAVDAHAVERLLRRLAEQPLGVGRRERRVGENHAEHRGHAGADHRRAFRHAEERVGDSSGVERRAGELGPRVGGHHAAGRGHHRIGIGAQTAGHDLDARLDLSERQELTDDAGREHEHARFGHGERSGRSAGHRGGIVEAAGARAGVGVARVDRDRAKARARRAGPIEGHGGGEHEIRGVDPGRSRRQVGHDERDVFAGRVALQARMGTRDAKTLR